MRDKRPAAAAISDCKRAIRSETSNKASLALSSSAFKSFSCARRRFTAEVSTPRQAGLRRKTHMRMLPSCYRNCDYGAHTCCNEQNCRP
ncbi:hypothetical protein AUP68_15142 [Ilyonectria robusta]